MTAEIFFNPARRRDGTGSAPGPGGPDGRTAGAAPSDHVIAMHRRLPGYDPTPIVDAPGLAAGLGLGRLSVKVESSRLGLPAFKMLGASWATYREVLRRLGVDDPAHAPAWRDLADLRQLAAPLGPLTLTAATDGNHGRAVARMAALLGYRARIFVPVGTAAARIDAIESEGATVTVVEGTYDDAVRASAAGAGPQTVVISDTSWEGYTDIPRWVIEGYSTIFAEADGQLPGPPDVVVVQMGVGALAAAVVAHYGARAAIVVVEPRSAACGLRSAEASHPVEVPGPHLSIMAGLNCGNVSVVAWPVVSAGADVFVAIDDDDAERAMRDLASIGVVAGETGGAGLAGLRALTEAADHIRDLALADAAVMVICTEGATDPDAYHRIVDQ